MDIRKGRPKKKESREKLHTRSFKLSRSDLDMLEIMRLHTGRSRSDILRDALRNEYDTYKKSREDEYIDYGYYDEEDDMDDDYE